MTTSVTALLLAAQASGGGTTLLPILLQFALIFAIFYFLMIRPQQKQRKVHEQNLLNLKKGDEVVTAGGLVGEVIHIRESMKDGQPARTMDDRVTIKSGESRLVVERGRIARITPRAAEPSSAA
ncbi:MAG: preprotein translocase subunit YajC [Chloroflexota bacterium]|nr:preprotein translocase subunit YajC [Chloroflexota bacterium]